MSSSRDTGQAAKPSDEASSMTIVNSIGANCDPAVESAGD
jgi:hypothetical protein